MMRCWHGATEAQRKRWAARLARYAHEAYLRDGTADPTDGPALYCEAYAAVGMPDDELWVLVGVASGEQGPTSEKPGLLRRFDCRLAQRETCAVVPWSHRASRVLREAWARLDGSAR